MSREHLQNTKYMIRQSSADTPEGVPTQEVRCYTVSSFLFCLIICLANVRSLTSLTLFRIDDTKPGGFESSNSSAALLPDRSPRS